jgi:hypothetical protein
VRHRKYTFFDPSRTLVELLALIERAKNDASVGGIAINLSGMRINPAMAWEVRQALQEFKTTGKRIVVYLDRADLRRYHFASVAHHIVLDPAGLIILEGLVAGQTYLKGALDKLGIGAEEWRFYDYKSTFESIVRHDMSDAERRQTRFLRPGPRRNLRRPPHRCHRIRPPGRRRNRLPTSGCLKTRSNRRIGPLGSGKRKHNQIGRPGASLNQTVCPAHPTR